jgi:hypothetical protein
MDKKRSNEFILEDNSYINQTINKKQKLYDDNDDNDDNKYYNKDKNYIKNLENKINEYKIIINIQTNQIEQYKNLINQLKEKKNENDRYNLYT